MYVLAYLLMSYKYVAVSTPHPPLTLTNGNTTFHVFLSLHHHTHVPTDYPGYSCVIKVISHLLQI